MRRNRPFLRARHAAEAQDTAQGRGRRHLERARRRWPRAAQGDSCGKGARVWPILPGQIFEGIYPTPKVIEVRGFSRTGRYGVYAELAYIFEAGRAGRLARPRGQWPRGLGNSQL